MATTTIPWGDGSGDNIYLTYPSASGDQTVQVSSDANTGSARSKVVTFTSGVGNITQQLTVNQDAGETPGGRVSDYVQDGLVLHLDGKQKGNTADAWTSLVGSAVFTNHGATFNADNVEFDGTDDYLNNTTFSSPLSGAGTIEVVLDDETFGTKLSLVFMSKTKGGLGFGKNASKHTLWSCGSASRAKPVATLAKASFSVSNVRKYQNGVSMTTSGSDYWGNQNTTNWIGRRNTGNYFKGKIYSIRIYNKQLTEAEVMQNLSVDNLRFNLGLTLNQ